MIERKVSELLFADIDPLLNWANDLKIKESSLVTTTKIQKIGKYCNLAISN